MKQHAKHLLWAALALAVLIGWFLLSGTAQRTKQTTFSTPQAASDALYAAVKAGNQPALLAMFGASGKALIESGDASEDAAARQTFAEKYSQMHRLATEPNGAVILYIGAENWPFPVPLAKTASGWNFDTDAGGREVVYRRIGHNEDAAIRTLRELAAAQHEYYEQAYDGEAAHAYAQHLISDAGKHNGLFWQPAAGGPQSPIGPLLAFAEVEAQAKAARTPAPFQGYYFHLLKQQGPNAPGGAKSYIANSRMTGGFAFLAWPAEYRSSGVFTFLIGPDGKVYEKNFGDGDAAATVASYDPDSTWTEIEP